jgi:hypothetical protein
MSSPTIHGKSWCCAPTIGAWIYLTKPESELLRPLPAGSLDVQTVREASD